MKCAYCRQEFAPRCDQQRYCSLKCRRKVERLRYSGKEVDLYFEPYEFECRRCGKKVRVTDIRDKRSVFCSARCEKIYWRHAYRYKNRGRTGNLGMSGGMSLQSLIRRERRSLD